MRRLKISVFIPLDKVEIVKDAMFKAGGGKYQNYDCCSFEHKGVGQFRALDGANPFVGKINEIARIEEIKVEMLCALDKINDVILAMKKAHPYEEVAYEVIELLDF